MVLDMLDCWVFFFADFFAGFFLFLYFCIPIWGFWWWLTTVVVLEVVVW